MKILARSSDIHYNTMPAPARSKTHADQREKSSKISSLMTSTYVKKLNMCKFYKNYLGTSKINLSIRLNMER